MILTSSTFLSILGATGVIFFGLAFRTKQFQSKNPRPAAIAVQLSMIAMLTGGLLADQARIDGFGIFEYLHRFILLTGLLACLFFVGWSYLRLFNQQMTSQNAEEDVEAEQGAPFNR